MRRSRRLILINMRNIIISTSVKSTTPTHPKAIIPAPAWVITAQSNMVPMEVVTAAVARYCHNRDTNASIEAQTTHMIAVVKTGRIGNGFTSCSYPSSVVSVCHPENVPSKKEAITARMMAAILPNDQKDVGDCELTTMHKTPPES